MKATPVFHFEVAGRRLLVVTSRQGANRVYALGGHDIVFESRASTGRLVDTVGRTRAQSETALTLRARELEQSPPMKPESARGIKPMTRIRSFGTAAVLALAASGLAGQAPAAIDTSKLGPQVGTVVPAFAGVDQFGKPHTLASTYGPKGAMLVFFRSADW